jgi:hypothetical protein
MKILMKCKGIILLFGVIPLSLTLSLVGCGETVNCENLCKRTLKCNVSFQPADDPDRAMVAVGDRTELESCTTGCVDNEIVTVESASCIDALPIENETACQNAMLDCLGALVSEETSP